MEQITPRAKSHRDYGPAVYPRRHSIDVECDYCDTVETFALDQSGEAYAAAYAHKH